MKAYPSLLLKKEINKDELSKIVEAAKSGDADALAAMCQYVYARIYSFLYYRVKHREDAEDLTSEVVLKMAKALKSQHGDFYAWIYRIARNRLIDFYRKRSVRQEASLDELPQDISDQKDSMPKDILTKDHLYEAMAHLTKEQADVITLKFIQEYDNEEVAMIMGKSIGAVKVLQFRALRALREYFRKKGYEIKN